jgi:2-oxoglutarate ferredoxin oxidoreductase subunit beta
VPLIKAGLMHKGFALIDVLSPCVTFNDHEGSTKSYEFVRDHYDEVVHADFVPPATEITTQYAAGEAQPVTLHDGSRITLRKLDPSYDPTHRGKAFNYLRDKLLQGEHVTGLIYVDENNPEFHQINRTSKTAMSQLPYARLTPGAKGLEKIMGRYK